MVKTWKTFKPTNSLSQQFNLQGFSLRNKWIARENICQMLKKKTNFSHVCAPTWLIHMHLMMPWYTWSGQRATRENQLSPSIMWAWGIELGSSGLAASAFTNWAFPLAQKPFFKYEVIRGFLLCSKVCYLGKTNHSYWFWGKVFCSQGSYRIYIYIAIDSV